MPWYLLLANTSFLLLSHSCGRVDQSEDVVEDVVAALAVGQKLEGLYVAHRPSLLLNLDGYNMSELEAFSRL